MTSPAFGLMMAGLFMIYSLTLQQVAISLGVLYMLGHGWALFQPEACRRFLLAAPRNYALGVSLLAAAGLWFCGIILFADLMDYQPYQQTFLILTVAATGAVAFYLKELLTARALGALLLLLADVLLDAAFLHNEPARLVVTLLAYAYAIIGMFLVGMPYLLRDILSWIYGSEQRARMAAWGGLLFGAILLILGIFVY